MLIKTLEVGPFGTNCYVLGDESSLKCAVIDPGGDSPAILDYIERTKLQCVAILLTHPHYDHVGALDSLLEEIDVPVYMSQKDANLKMVPGMPGFRPPANCVFVKTGDIISIGELRVGVIETPGHTPGGLTFMCENALFVGDTLFRGSCGRTDFIGSDMNEEMRSLKRLASLEGDYEVYPGHMEHTTLEAERRSNPYVMMAVKKY